MAAQDEANTVAAKLGNTCAVSKLIGKNARADDVVTQLCATDWSIIHIAAHGILQGQANGKATGVLLARDMVLTADMLKQLLPVTPEFVFVNCCHLGTTDTKPILGKPNEFAASVATGLIDMGVTSVIAAGWAVDDQAASQFAQTFYDRLLEGATFAVAVREARREIYTHFRGLTTWGAYQCYGEPDWRLMPANQKTRRVSVAYSSIAELINDVDQISQDAQTGMARSRTDEIKKLDGMLSVGRKINVRWENDPDLLSSLGRAYGELGELQKACDCYVKAIQAEKANTPLRSIEQLANLRIRSAVIARTPGTDYKQISEEVLGNIEALSKLVGAESIERLNLRGACHKRLAQVFRGTKRVRELSLMARWYGEAERQARRTRGPDPYPMLMCVSARVAAEVRKPSGKAILAPELMKLLDEAKKKSIADDKATPSFWSAVAEADALLLECLVAGDLNEDERKKIEKAYLRRWNRGGSWLKFRSVLEQIQFFIDVWDDGEDSTRKKREDLRSALVRLLDELEAGIQTKQVS
jgi:hypothetical protein